MRRIFAFNGDADGLCALQQLRLEEPAQQDVVLVSGPKRRIGLLEEIDAREGDHLTVLDVSFDVNRAAVERLLAAGVRIAYFDHHSAKNLVRHPLLEAHFDYSPAVCTSLIVDRHLRGKHRAWSVVGAFGDNLDASARALAAQLELDGARIEALQRLGIALNYNSYGETERDLLIPPVDLHHRLLLHADPHDFMHADELFERLSECHAEDLARAAGLRPTVTREHAAVYVLPDESWARRVGGVLANRLARQSPARAHALLVPNAKGGMVVSVRSALEWPRDAALLCSSYPGGGGRQGAGGINDLPRDEVERFIARFIDHFARSATA